MAITTTSSDRPVALVTGASRGLGAALASGLAQHRWRLIIDAREPAALYAHADELGGAPAVVPIVGDVTDPVHRQALAQAVRDAGRLDLLVNNAGTLGPSPLPRLQDVDRQTLLSVYDVNTVAPLMLFQAVLEFLETGGGTVINVTSDAASGSWPGWGVYGSSKAALDQLSGVLSAEHPALRIYAVDPGDLRTAMHQAAFPGEDISDRLDPSAVVDSILTLVDRRRPSGRYRASDLADAVAVRQ